MMTTTCVPEESLNKIVNKSVIEQSAQPPTVIVQLYNVHMDVKGGDTPWW